MGEDGFVGRWGGEEFIVVFKTDQLEVMQEKAQQICQTIEEYSFSNIKNVITITLGLCAFNPNQDINTIIVAADRGLYEGKNAGRNQYVITKE